MGYAHNDIEKRNSMQKSLYGIRKAKRSTALALQNFRNLQKK